MTSRGWWRQSVGHGAPHHPHAAGQAGLRPAHGQRSSRRSWSTQLESARARGSRDPGAAAAGPRCAPQTGRWPGSASSAVVAASEAMRHAEAQQAREAARVLPPPPPPAAAAAVPAWSAAAQREARTSRRRSSPPSSNGLGACGSVEAHLAGRGAPGEGHRRAQKTRRRRCARRRCSARCRTADPASTASSALGTATASRRWRSAPSCAASRTLHGRRRRARGARLRRLGRHAPGGRRSGCGAGSTCTRPARTPWPAWWPRPRRPWAAAASVTGGAHRRSSGFCEALLAGAVELELSRGAVRRRRAGGLHYATAGLEEARRHVGQDVGQGGDQAGAASSRSRWSARCTPRCWTSTRHAARWTSGSRSPPQEGAAPQRPSGWWPCSRRPSTSSRARSSSTRESLAADTPCLSALRSPRRIVTRPSSRAAAGAGRRCARPRRRPRTRASRQRLAARDKGAAKDQSTEVSRPSSAELEFLEKAVAAAGCVQRRPRRPARPPRARDPRTGAPTRPHDPRGHATARAHAPHALTRPRDHMSSRHTTTRHVTTRPHATSRPHATTRLEPDARRLALSRDLRHDGRWRVDRQPRAPPALAGDAAAGRAAAAAGGRARRACTPKIETPGQGVAAVDPGGPEGRPPRATACPWPCLQAAGCWAAPARAASSATSCKKLDAGKGADPCRVSAPSASLAKLDGRARRSRPTSSTSIKERRAQPRLRRGGGPRHRGRWRWRGTRRGARASGGDDDGARLRHSRVPDTPAPSRAYPAP